VILRIVKFQLGVSFCWIYYRMHCGHCSHACMFGFAVSLTESRLSLCDFGFPNTHLAPNAFLTLPTQRHCSLCEY